MATMAASKPKVIASNQSAVKASPQTTTSGGYSTYQLVSAATNNATVIKASAGTVGSIEVFNNSSTIYYLKFYNTASTPNPASDTPIKTIMIPQASGQGGSSIITFSTPLYFSTGISVALVANIGVTDNTAIAANAVVVNINYATTTPYQTVVLAESSLVSYWRLGEASGTFADSKGSNTATVTGAMTYSATGLITNNTNNAVSNNGTTARYISAPYSSTLNTTQWSIEFWTKPASLADHQRIWYTQLQPGASSTNTGVVVHIAQTTGKILCEPNGGTDPYYTDLLSATGLTVGNTYHVVCTYDGTNIRIYINGVLDAGPIAGVYSVNTAANTLIGVEFDLSSYTINGTLDEVAYYNTALSAATILRHYNVGMGASG